MKYLTVEASGFITNTGMAPDLATARLQVLNDDDLFVAPDDIGEINNILMRVENDRVVWTDPDKAGETVCRIERILPET